MIEYYHDCKRKNRTKSAIFYDKIGVFEIRGRRPAIARTDSSGVYTDDRGRETAQHGTALYPLACYEDDLHKFTVIWHWHEEFECIVATEGNVDVLLEGKRLRLEPGEGVFINSGALHAVEAGDQPRSVLRSIVFHPRLIGGSMDSIFWQRLAAPLLQDSQLRYLALSPEVPWQSCLLRETLAAWRASVEEWEDYENLVRYRLSGAFRKLHENRPAPPKKRHRQDQVAAQRIKTMLRFIEEHYSEDLTVERIAQSVAVSGSVCLRTFRQMLGTTPIQYVRQLRIGKAAQLLLTTDRKIRDVGLACGFSDLSYFTKAFREEKGCTPRQYRDTPEAMRKERQDARDQNG